MTSKSDQNFDFANLSIINPENNENLSHDTHSQISQEIVNDLFPSNNLNNESIKQFKCENCSDPIIIDFIKNNFDELNLSCQCYTKKSIKIEEIESKLKDYNSNYNNYINYCNLCDIYLDNEDSNKHPKAHKKYFIVFEKLNTAHDIRIIEEMLLDEEINNNKKFKTMNKNNKLKKIIDILINDYEYNEKNLIIINNIKNILNHFKIKINYLYELEDYIKETNPNKNIKNNINDHEYKQSSLEEIRVIELNGANNNDILNKLCCNEIKNKLVNLLELTLMNSNLNDIKPLLNVNFKNLKLLNLELNKLSDDMIDIIKDLKFPELKELKLENNNFTNYDIFKSIQSFKKLENFNIKSNRFIYNGDKNKYKNISLNTIKEMDVSNGVFVDNSIELLFQFELKELEILKLNGNYLSLFPFKNILSFINESKWTKLKELQIIKGDMIKDGIITIINEIEEKMKLENKKLIIKLNKNGLKEENIVVKNIEIPNKKN